MEVSSNHDNQQKKKIAVIGNGWAALTALGLLRAREGVELIWITGSGSRLHAPLPTLDASSESRAVAVWTKLQDTLGFTSERALSGSFLREFRNKAFREPAWTKAPTPQERTEVRNELLWSPEIAWVPVFEAHLGTPWAELEEAVRVRLMSEADGEGVEGADAEVGAGKRAGRAAQKTADAAEAVQAGAMSAAVAPAGRIERRIDGVPVTGFRVEGGRAHAVILGSGDEIEADEFVFADRWANLGALTGLPKALPFTRKRNVAGALQAVFNHRAPMGVGLSEGFYSTLHRDAGDEFDRRVWGHFSADGMRSVWTVCLTTEEGEDNHQIAKKLRRMKSALDKMFEGSSWLSGSSAPGASTGGAAAAADFMANVADEQVRFEEHSIFLDGEPITEPQKVASVEGLSFLTDGYGPSFALNQVGVLLGIEAEPAAPVAELGEAESTPEADSPAAGEAGA